MKSTTQLFILSSQLLILVSSCIPHFSHIYVGCKGTNLCTFFFHLVMLVLVIIISVICINLKPKWILILILFTKVLIFLSKTRHVLRVIFKCLTSMQCSLFTDSTCVALFSILYKKIMLLI